MKPESAASDSSPRAPSAPQRAPSQITTKKMLWAMAIIYALWLTWMGYVAWVNVQAGNQ